MHAQFANFILMVFVSLNLGSVFCASHFCQICVGGYKDLIFICGFPFLLNSVLILSRLGGGLIYQGCI